MLHQMRLFKEYAAKRAPPPGASFDEIRERGKTMDLPALSLLFRDLGLTPVSYTHLTLPTTPYV